MNWLLWREYRLNRQILIAGVVLFLLPYLIVVSAYLWSNGEELGEPWSLRSGLGAAAIYSYGLSQLTIAFLGGNVFAGERSDRSAEFIAYMPVSKPRRISSKLIVIAVVAALIWGLNLLVIWALRNGLPSEIREFDPKYVAITGLVMFGVGWCVSSFQSSPTLAVCAGVAAPMLIYIGLHLFALPYQPSQYDLIVKAGYLDLSRALGLAGLVIGTWCFLKRIEP